MNNPSLDRIYIRDLTARCILGIFPEERTKAQEVLINITLFSDTRRAGKTDCIEDTVDYKNIKNEILTLVESSSFFLVEKLAREIARCCLRAEGVEEVLVTVDKPGALRFARSVAVEIFRKKSDM
ncbi:MAG: dihydroneopterin aldolase [Candidatus Hydrogenedens sp.]|nr:dihydroneopterin aldolase [Candidatus Hydrogenedens sp.]